MKEKILHEFVLPDELIEARRKQKFLSSIIILFALLLVLSLTLLAFLFTWNISHPYGLQDEPSFIRLEKFEPIESSKFSGFNNFISKLMETSSLAKQASPEGQSPKADRCALATQLKFDCNPDEPINQQRCEARGCCWVPAHENHQRENLPPLNVPYCFYPQDYQLYKVVDIVQENKKGALIKLAGTSASGFPKDIPNVNVEISGLDNQRLRIRVVDADQSRFEVPLPYFNLSQVENIDSPLYDVMVAQNGTLKIARKATGIIIFETDLTKLIYSDQYIQLIAQVPSDSLYGLGEHKDTFRKSLQGWSRYTMFNRDVGPSPNVNLYGSYPFYMMVENDSEKNAHGVFLLNSNGMDVLLQPTAVTWRTTGGILDFFILMGPSAPEVVRQNINMIGKPVMQPFWSFGFHLCRYGYNSLAKTRETTLRTIEAGIPLETQWNDIDYMDQHNDFTYDQVNFKGLPDFVNELHSKDMHYVVILDPGVSASETPGTYPPYDEGLTDDIFIKNSIGGVLIGKVWNTVSTAFPDFTNPKTEQYWLRQLKYLKEKFAYDGIWIDMNEPSNFVNGALSGCPASSYENAPYAPGGTSLNTKTACMTAQQHLGIHYNVHNLYGLYEAVQTHNALKNLTNKRPFVVSRASYPSLGGFAAHWSGDISSSYDHMQYSISNMLEFNIYGIPMIGSDICGFTGNADQDLCMRWSALGAFYPFSRNHNNDNSQEQDPVALGPKVVAAAKYALEHRYKLLPYLYTLFFKAHTEADTVIRPLFFEFPQDEKVYGIESQFLWGSGLMIVPILQSYTTQVDAYFPKGFWYDLATMQLAFKSTGQTQKLTIDDDKIGLFIRGGTIIPSYQNSAMTIAQLRKQDLYFVVAPDENGLAFGEYFTDDGESLNTIEKGEYTFGKCTSSQGNLKCITEKANAMETAKVGGAVFLGIAKRPKSVRVNGRAQNDWATYNETSQTLTIRFQEAFGMSQSFEIEYN